MRAILASALVLVLALAGLGCRAPNGRATSVVEPIADGGAPEGDGAVTPGDDDPLEVGPIPPVDDPEAEEIDSPDGFGGGIDDPTFDAIRPEGSGGGDGDASASATAAAITSSTIRAEDPCETLRPTIRGTDGPDVLRGTDGRDVIFAGSGDDVVWGNGGNDVICAGGGADEIHGGDGNDYIDAGFGRDWVDGGAGHDRIHGRSGGDTIFGGHGNDVLFGDLLDDELFGEEGHDVLVGGHGIDIMHGGPGNDILRGDTNRDEMTGGEGEDLVSFLTATPPGQPLGDAIVPGVVVNSHDLGSSRASGDGYVEALAGLEIIVGSAFDDRLVGGPRVVGGWGDDVLEGPGMLEPGEGQDSCNGAACGTVSRDGHAVAMLAGPARDLGLVAIGSPASDRIEISIESGAAVVRGAGIDPGPGCRAVDASTVRCPLRYELRSITAYGDAGDDQILLTGRFPRDLTATLDGGDGDDVLRGHPGQDILFAGRSGNDTLEGLDGDDALITESDDRDILRAGAGNDQLVANAPCARHEFSGGAGIDVGGFARIGTHFDTAAERQRQRLHAHIGGVAYQPALCDVSSGTSLATDIEILEGAGGDDELIGSEGDDVIWGWGGDDVIRGLGGHDDIEGHEGNDTLYGGAGRDRLAGGAGFDVLHAADGERDAELSCGTGEGRLENSDPVDPAGANCR